ncbi:MAG: hypothetical protein KJ556_00650, partial [Gammaproteobacteria bacterium]|nr:hypothetical protein [Gammaproteobacteria bacterium]MBU2247393.1 hypothetical protein [Gammaproteobacteria bacterium]
LYLITFVLAFECFVLFFGETIITHSFAAYFSYRKDQHALAEALKEQVSFQKEPKKPKRNID